MRQPKQSPSRFVRRSLLGGWFALLTALSACSDGHKGGACEGDECGLDGGAGAPMQTGKQTMKDGSLVRHNELTPDASSLELQAHLQVNGANTQCGTCAVVLAQVQGGVYPYTYQWSDSSLTGPGPHMVCPSEPTSYSVVITDSTPTTVGEFSSAAQQVEAQGRVDCVADAGVAADALLGCTASATNTSENADAGASDASVTCMEPGDASVTWDLANGAEGTVTTSTYNAKVFKAGLSYEYTQDRLVPLTLTTGDAILVDVYGGKSHCMPAQKLFTITWDLFTWHQSFCFVPQEDFQYVIVAIHLNGALFSWELLAGGTLCSGCSMK
ncbi:MAG: hypothetical protein JWN04_561 [Myxococcaceae bacterium]|nr:hypothetical protein [Myxococcaceae bacterium]